MNPGIWIIPFIAAFIGWLINHLYVRFLFQPRVPKKIAGISLHGIIPKYKSEFADKMGTYVAENIFSFEELELKIINPENVTKIMPVIEGHIDEFLKVKLTKEMPFLSMFIGTKTINSLKKTFMDELTTLFPLVMKNYAANLKNEFDIKKIIKEKIEKIDLQKMEILFYTMGSKQIKKFKIIGAISGFLIGIIQSVLYAILS